MRRALASSAIAASSMAGLTSLRHLSKADTALSNTLADNSEVESPGRTLECTYGTPVTRLPASLSLKSGRPVQPSERQNRITVGWLTPARLAISATVAWITWFGWPSTSCDTLRSAADSDSSWLLMRSSMDAFMEVRVPSTHPA